MPTKIRLAKPTTPPPAQPTKSYRVLVADDEVPLAKALQMKLSSNGFTVDVAFNGEESIEFLNQNKYDLILLDLIMPKIDGFGVLAKLKETGVTTPVIVLSNLGQDVDKGKATEMGATAYFVKSNTALSEIVQFIRQLLPANEPPKSGDTRLAA